jgi:hypothetical protein
LESGCAVDIVRPRHREVAVQNDAAVTEASGSRNELIYQSPTDFMSPEPRPDVQTLELAGLAVVALQRYASSRLAIDRCEQKAAGWRRIDAR